MVTDMTDAGEVVTYTVTMERVGRQHNMAPVEVLACKGKTDDQTAELLAEAVYRKFRSMLISLDWDVTIGYTNKELTAGKVLLERGRFGEGTFEVK